MRKIIIAIFGLLPGVTGMLHAQERRPKANASPERIFELPAFSTTSEFHIQLANGNMVELKLSDVSDLAKLDNIDSLLMVFLSDMKPFRDSLSDPLTTKRIDFLIDSSGHKKLRIRQARPSAPTFLVDGGEPSVIKLAQDTVYILIVGRMPAPKNPKAIIPVRYDRIGFLLNQYSELETLVTTGLNNKIRLIRNSQNVNYSFRTRYGRNYMVADPSITAHGHTGDQLGLNGYVNAQNFKSYFSPSIDVGAAVRLFHGNNSNSIGVYWEPTFLFKPDAQGRLQTYRNDFIVGQFGFDQGADRNAPDLSKTTFGIGTNISLGYLIRNRGDFFEPHSFRLTIGSLKALKGGLHLDPVLYFNDFFKGVTPGIRLSLGGF